MLSEKEKIELITQISLDLNETKDVDLLLERILTNVRKFYNADAGSIYLKNGPDLMFSYTQNDTLQKRLEPGKKLIFNTFRVPINNSSIAGFVANTLKTVNIPDVYGLNHSVPFTFDPHFDQISNYHTGSILAVPMTNQSGELLGVMQLINAKDEQSRMTAFSRIDESLIKYFATSAALALDRAQMTRNIILRMISMAELRDPKETCAHVNRVAAYAVEIYENWANRKGIQAGTIEHKKELRGALESLATRSKKYRTLLNLSLSLQESDKKMAMALSKFTESGPYGYLLDGTQGSLSNAAWITFELAKLMESNKDAIEPVLTCLFHKLEQLFTGKPTLLILDEAWTYLKNKLFLDKIQTWLRELRKNEVSVIFASQSLADAIDTPLMPLLLESCQTKILLPNKEALNPAISLMYKKIGLNEPQITIISQAIGKKQYFYYSSCGVRLFDLTMGELALAICCNAGIEVSNQCDEIITKHGKDRFLEEWLKLKKLDWAANIIKAKTKVRSEELYEICNY